MRPPAGLCPPNAEMPARAFRPEGGCGGARSPENTDGVPPALGGASAAGGLRVSRVRGALGGLGPRAPRARCVPRPARKARRAGAARLRAATSPPPPGPWGFGRQGAGVRGATVRGGPAGANRADRCPGTARGPCWQPARRFRVEKVTGLQASRLGAALWKAGRVSPERSAWTEELEAGRDVGHSSPRHSQRKASGLGTRHLSPRPFQAAACDPLGRLPDRGFWGTWVFLKIGVCQVLDYRGFAPEPSFEDSGW